MWFYILYFLRQVCLQETGDPQRSDWQHGGFLSMSPRQPINKWTETCVVFILIITVINILRETTELSLRSRNSDFCAQRPVCSHSLESGRWSSAQRTHTLTRKVCIWDSAYSSSFCVVFNSPPLFCPSLCHFSGVCGGSAQASGSGSPWQWWVEWHVTTPSALSLTIFITMIRKESTTCLFLPQKLSISSEATTWQSGTACSSTTSLRHMFCHTAAKRTALGSQVKQPSLFTIFTRLPNHLLIVGSRPSHENLWRFCLQALELEFPSTGTVLDLLRSSMEKRWTVTWMFDSSDLLQYLAWLKHYLLFIQRWFFYPPEREPHFDRNRTTLSWVTEVYPNLPEDEAPLECTLRPGEVTTHISWNMDTQGFITRRLLQNLRIDYGLKMVRFFRAHFFLKSPLDVT